MRAVLFPGQGSQYVGMGLDFYNFSEKAKNYYKKASKILGFNLEDISFYGPEKNLSPESA